MAKQNCSWAVVNWAKPPCRVYPSQFAHLRIGKKRLQSGRMIEQIEAIENEEVDDIPLLLAVIKQMGLIEVLNESLEQHGNWEGLGAGHLIGVWLAYILSTGDHRKSQLEEWVEERKHTLEQSLGVEEIKGLDFTDDRLGIILHKLSDDEKWQRSECEVNQRIVRVYELEEEIARIE